MRIHRGLPATYPPYGRPGPIDEDQNEREEQGATPHSVAVPQDKTRSGDVAAFVALPVFRLSAVPNRFGMRMGGPLETRKAGTGGDSLSMGLSQQSLTAGPCSCIMAGAGRALMLADTMWPPNWSERWLLPNGLILRLITYVLSGQAIDDLPRNISAGWDSHCIGMGTPQKCAVFFRL